MTAPDPSEAPTNTRPGVRSLLPLRPTVLLILLALEQRPRHGYGIMLAVRAQSEGAVDLGTSHLYRHLGKLLDGCLIAHAETPESDADARRRYYDLTPFGRDVLAAEIARLAAIVERNRGLIQSKAAR